MTVTGEKARFALTTLLTLVVFNTSVFEEMAAHDSSHSYYSSFLLFLTDILGLFKVPSSRHTPECTRLHFYGNTFFQRNKRHVKWSAMKMLYE